MPRLIDADALNFEKLKHESYPDLSAKEIVEDAPTVDAVPVDVVARMFYEFSGDKCACNFNSTDEWLSLVCKYTGDGICPYPEDILGCWKQYIKHYDKRKENTDD